MKTKSVRQLSSDQQREKCEEFLKMFEDYDSGETDEQHGWKKYMVKMQRVANRDDSAIEILFEDLETFFRKEDEKVLLEGIRTNISRYISIFTEAAHKLMPKRTSAINDDDIKERYENILRDQRIENFHEQASSSLAERELIPTSLQKRFDLTIIFGPNAKQHLQSITELDAHQIGSLVSCKAIVVRTGEVKSQLKVANYACDLCGCENYQPVIDKDYKPLVKCTSKKCVANKVNGKLTFLPGHSIFISYQQLKIQETSDQLKQGTIPRTFSLHLKGNQVKQASPGDVVVIQGILLPMRKVGFKHQFDLDFNCFIEAVKITREKKKYVEMAITEEQINRIETVRANIKEEDLFNQMAKSIAPQIYGLEAVKKALLLMLVGGITKQTHDHLRIRGQINIALIGDPGIAKSQLLKHISYVAPRGIYTTGKGSSGVGLTAAITVDPTSKELSLEAGALVLADMGICCIDEFDKMDEYDRTAIHEVMEQQTVSIAKAGITTSLNARTSILAAANPIFGRYNRKETPHKNINLPAALLSRFDLIFILLDECDKERDLELSKHIGQVHQKNKAPQSQVFESSFLRSYVAVAKTHNPVICEQLHEEMIRRYIEKRNQQRDITKQGESYTTTRSLLALVRLSQARARLRMSSQVSHSDVMECLDIMQQCQRNITFSPEMNKHKLDPMSAIFGIIKSYCLYSQNSSVERADVEKRVIAKGYSIEDLENSLKNYQSLNVLMVQDGVIMLIE